MNHVLAPTGKAVTAVSTHGSGPTGACAGEHEDRKTANVVVHAE
ncbi:hypothetical protein [Haladaptatus sp. NG-WS-4]